MTTPQEILQTPMEANDAGAATIGQYFAILSAMVWHEGEGFSGKWPFGNSDWQDGIIHALILNGHLAGTLDEYGCVEEYSESALHTLMDSVFVLLSDADYSDLALPPGPKEFYLMELDPCGALLDHSGVPLTEESAKSLLETEYSGTWQPGWRVVHIPPVR